MLSETNIRGFVSDRISWLKYMVEQETLEKYLPRGIPFRGWYPFVDSTGLMFARDTGKLQHRPAGIFCLIANQRKENAFGVELIFQRRWRAGR